MSVDYFVLIAHIVIVDYMANGPYCSEGLQLCDKSDPMRNSATARPTSMYAFSKFPTYR